MNFDIESTFVKKHIRKEYQERLLFELQSPKKREKALSRFAHSCQLILKDHFIRVQTLPKFNDLPFKIDYSCSCYIVSGGENDGSTLTLLDAINFCNTSYMTVILITPELIIVKEECEGKGASWFIAEALANK